MLLIAFWDVPLVLLNVLLMGAALVIVTGWMRLHGLHINHPTLINLVPLVGIGLDSAIHITAAYQIATRSRCEKPVETAMLHTLPGVMLGQITSAIPIIFLMGSTSYVIRSFWICWIGMLAFNTYLAVAVLPILLVLKDSLGT